MTLAKAAASIFVVAGFAAAAQAASVISADGDGTGSANVDQALSRAELEKTGISISTTDGLNIQGLSPDNPNVAVNSNTGATLGGPSADMPNLNASSPAGVNILGFDPTSLVSTGLGALSNVPGAQGSLTGNMNIGGAMPGGLGVPH
jgi:hypothetical protein